MSQSDDKDPKKLKIRKFYLDELKYDHYLALKDSMTKLNLGLNLDNLLKKSFNKGLVSKWINRKSPFNADAILLMRVMHDLEWDDVHHPSVLDQKNKALATTIDHIGRSHGGLSGDLFDVKCLSLIKVYISGSVAAISSFPTPRLHGADLSSREVLKQILTRIRSECPFVKGQSDDEIVGFIRKWVQHYCDCVLSLQDSFPMLAYILEHLDVEAS